MQHSGWQGAELAQFDLTMPPEEPAVLIVEDEPSMRSLLHATIRQRHPRCDTAGSLAEARAELSRRSYDIILLDLGLPDGPGTDLLEERRELARESVVVVITGRQDLDTAVHVIRQGVFDYITKPFTLAVLMERMETIVMEWKSRVRYRYYNNHLEGLVNAMTQRLLETTQQVEGAYDMTVTALGAALDLRDPETEEHCRRVSENSARLGRELGLVGAALRDLRWGSYLHDIGKIGISEHILLKPAALTGAEREMIKMHPLLGYRMISGISFLKGAGTVVQAHHEKFDGTGYPSGLKGEGIPLPARVFALIDAVDAMLTDRPYRRAIGFEAMRGEIHAQAGRHFDPTIVEAFEKVPRQLWWIATPIETIPTDRSQSIAQTGQRR
jgi:putative two-component system response regulator